LSFTSCTRRTKQATICLVEILLLSAIGEVLGTNGRGLRGDGVDSMFFVEVDAGGVESAFPADPPETVLDLDPISKRPKLVFFVI